MNFRLNGIEDLIYKEMIVYQKSVSRSWLKYFADGIAKLYFFHKLVDNSFTEC